MLGVRFRAGTLLETPRAVEIHLRSDAVRIVPPAGAVGRPLRTPPRGLPWTYFQVPSDRGANALWPDAGWRIKVGGRTDVQRLVAAIDAALASGASSIAIGALSATEEAVFTPPLVIDLGHVWVWPAAWGRTNPGKAASLARDTVANGDGSRLKALRMRRVRGCPANDCVRMHRHELPGREPVDGSSLLSQRWSCPRVEQRVPSHKNSATH